MNTKDCAFVRFLCVVLMVFFVGCGFFDKDDEKRSTENENAIDQLASATGTVSVSLTGGTNSSGIWSIWKYTGGIDGYFIRGEEGDDMSGVDLDAYFLLGNTKMITIVRLADSWYILSDETDNYTYNATTGEIIAETLKIKFIDNGDGTADLIKYDPGDLWSYEEITKVDSLTCSARAVTEDEYISAYIRNYFTSILSQGDGTSTGSITLTLDYMGTQTVNEDNPIFICVYDTANDDCVSATYAFSSEPSTIELSGIPAGNYILLFSTMIYGLLRPDEPFAVDDYYAFYYNNGGAGGLTWSSTTAAGDPIVLADGQQLVIANPIQFNDSYISVSEQTTTLNSVSFNDDAVDGAGQITVTVELANTDAGDKVDVVLYSPTAYTNCDDNGYMFGQRIRKTMSYVSSAWTATLDIAAQHEEGSWRVGKIIIDIDNNGSDIFTYTTSVDGDCYDTYYYISADESEIEYTPVSAASFTHNTLNPDTAGPVITWSGISGDGTLTSGETEYISFIADGTGFSGNESNAGMIFLYHSSDTYLENPLIKNISYVYNGPGDQYYSVGISYDDLSTSGNWTAKHIILYDVWGNKSNYFIYDGAFYNTIDYYDWGNDGQYCLLQFGSILPDTSPDIDPIIIAK